MKVVFLSTVSPYDRNAWSGISYHMFRSISGFHDVVWSGPPEIGDWDSVKFKLVQKWRHWRHKKYTDQNLHYARMLGRWATRAVQRSGADLVFIGAGEPEIFAFLGVEVPVIYAADATFSLKNDFYPWYSGLTPAFAREGRQVERLALSRSYRIIMSSEWAKDSAVRDYHVAGEKIIILPFGPNLLRIPAGTTPRTGSVLELLFICTSWDRKGGDDAIAVYKLLKPRIPCRLTVLGHLPAQREDGVRYIPFLDKNDQAGEEGYMNILAESHLVLMPSKADCTPVAVSDAAAFGLPVICYDTGGLSAVVKNGVNGYCIPATSGASGLAETIVGISADPEAFEALRAGARNAYDQALNWRHWISQVNTLFCLPAQS